MGADGLPEAFAACPPARPRIAALVLAAGLSRRMAPRNKLLLPAGGGGPMVAQVSANCCAAGIADVIVVLGHQAEQVEAAVRAGVGGQTILFVRAENYAAGLSASLRAGILALPADVAGVLVCLGDMPLVSPRIIARLAAAYDPEQGRVIVVPSCHGRLGNPVLWDRRFFNDMLGLAGDIGARALLRRYAGQMCQVEADRGVLVDFDTPESLAADVPPPP